MKRDRKKSGHGFSFTLIEMLTAMAVFMIISVIMMQFFNSAQQIVSKASQRDEVFANARIAFDLITRDLQGALYNNHGGTTPSGDDDYAAIYPFLFQKINTIGPNNYYPSFYSASGIDWNCLNFIATTNVDNPGTSKICELRYSFVPAGEEFTNPDGSKIDSGWLIRSCTANKLDDHVTDNSRYNFAEQYLRESSGSSSNDGRVNIIWIDKSGADPVATTGAQPNPSYNNFKKVIPYVYNFKITCYGGDLSKYNPIDLSGVAKTDNAEHFGSPFPVAIKIELDMFSSSDWKRWKKFVDDGNTVAADKLLQTRLFRFNKTIYLPRKKTL